MSTPRQRTEGALPEPESFWTRFWRALFAIRRFPSL